MSSYPITMWKMKFDSWWGKKSVLVHPDSPFYQLKKMFMGRIDSEPNINLDAQNMTPHVNLNGNGLLYKHYHDQECQVDNTTIYMHRNFIEIALKSGTVSIKHINTLSPHDNKRHNDIIHMTVYHNKHDFTPEQRERYTEILHDCIRQVCKNMNIGYRDILK